MSAPDGYNKLRACTRCKLIKTENQWVEEGCENCSLGKNEFDVEESTTTFFEGVLGLMSPNLSWVAKWNKLDDKIAGCYALDVPGNLENANYDDEDTDG